MSEFNRAFCFLGFADMVSSKYLKTAYKGKGLSSSRTVSGTASPGKEAKGGTAVPCESREVVVVSSPEKESKERRVKRKHDSSTQQKEAKKQKTAEAETQETVEAGKQKTAEAEKQKAAEEAGKQKTADTAIVSSSAVPTSSLIFVSGLPPPNIPLPRSFDKIDIQRTNAFMARCPSSSELKQLAIPPTVCVEEKKWLASLPADALHFETSKYFEMVCYSC